MAWSHKKTLHLVCLVLLLMTTFQGSHATRRPSLTPEELRYIASLNLCHHFRGTCGAACTHYVVHRWRFPLCANRTWKCCVNLSDYEGANIQNEQTTLMTTTTTSTTTTTTPVPTTSMAEPSDSCGRMERPNRRRKRIVGGSVSAPGTWPWLVALRSLLGAHACSGALIAQRWVVTAAHCFKRVSLASAWRVRVGERHLLHVDENERDIRIANIFVFPGFRTRSAEGSNTTLYARYKHDLALLQLASDAQVEPICLPPSAEGDQELPGDNPPVESLPTTPSSSSLRRQLGGGGGGGDADGGDQGPVGVEGVGECWVSGWGSTRDASQQNPVLRDVQGEVISSQECGAQWGTQLERDMLCFGNGTYGPCEGDSGGPLSCQRGGRWFLEGVISWGTENCTISGYPSVLTRLPPFLPWIRHIQRHN